MVLSPLILRQFIFPRREYTTHSVRPGWRCDALVAILLLDVLPLSQN
jgi:hypothetical protein